MKKYLVVLALTLVCTMHAVESTVPAPKAGEFVWNELATTDVKKAKEFYSKVFGWEFVDKKMDDGMTYTIIKKGEKEFGGIWAIPAEQQSQIPAHWLAYVLVDNVEKSLELATKNGATVLKPTQKAGDMGIFAIIQDPSGAHLALWQTIKP